MNFEDIKQNAFADEMEKIALSQKTLIRSAVKSWPKEFGGLEKKLIRLAKKTGPASVREEVLSSLLNRPNASAVRQAGPRSGFDVYMSRTAHNPANRKGVHANTFNRALRERIG